jgi:hypothetical protein
MPLTTSMRLSRERDFFNLTDSASEHPTACRRRPQLWLSEDPTERLAAKQMCHACPLLTECQESGIRNNEPEGVWGGLDFEDRQNIRRAERTQRRRQLRVEAEAAAYGQLEFAL